MASARGKVQVMAIYIDCPHCKHIQESFQSDIESEKSRVWEPAMLPDEQKMNCQKCKRVFTLPKWLY